MITAGLQIGVIIAFSPLELSCTSKQAPGCTYSQRNAHDCADCEIKGARIEQNLKCVTHSRSSGAAGIASRCGQPPCTSPSSAGLGRVASAVGSRTKTRSRMLAPNSTMCAHPKYPRSNPSKQKRLQRQNDDPVVNWLEQIGMNRVSATLFIAGLFV